jgi:hypothetical protein
LGWIHSLTPSIRSRAEGGVTMRATGSLGDHRILYLVVEGDAWAVRGRRRRQAQIKRPRDSISAVAVSYLGTLGRCTPLDASFRPSFPIARLRKLTPGSRPGWGPYQPNGENLERG